MSRAAGEVNGMEFCTVINCMDGRVQLPVIQFLKRRFGVGYVDSITEAGPTLILAKRSNAALVKGILGRLRISVEKHSSVGIAIVGHQDCAGNPAPYDHQLAHIRDSVQFLHSQYPSVKVIGLWVDGDWRVHEVVGDMATEP
jgi:carbonic anhydrase